MRAVAPLLLMVATAPALSGCIAAAAPVLASGMIARVTVLKDKPAAAKVAAERTDTPPPTVAPPPGAIARSGPGPTSAEAPAGPTGLAAASPDTATMGDEMAAGETTAAAIGANEPGWPALVRFVARNKTVPSHSALLVRGGAVADPHWVGCEGKPPAVLAPVSLVLRGEGSAGKIAERDLGWIVALPLMGTALVLVADGPAEATAARAAFARTDMARPIVGDTLVTVASEADLPAARAAVGARYCVMALAGRRAADFPHALLPASTPAVLASQWNAGWFWFGPDGG